MSNLIDKIRGLQPTTPENVSTDFLNRSVSQMNATNPLTLSHKVDKVDGKELSTNDYTNEEKTKLEGIEAGAQVNPEIDTAMSATSENAVQNKVITVALNEKISKSEVDTAMSDASTNVVQNKVIKSYVDEKVKKFDVDTTMSDTSENPVQNKVIKAYVDGKKTSFIIDCPVFTNQPTITGSLNSAFKIWYENYYYVHILDEAAGTFGLMELRSDTTTLIDQTFTLSGLNTGNAGVLRENSPIDFLSIGDSWQMRSAGVNSVTPTNLNAKRLDISINGYANGSGYLSISYINGNSKFTNVKFNNGRFGVYTGDQGFVLGGSAINSKNVYLSAKFGMEINKKHINISGDYTALRMSDDNLFGYYTPITMLDYPINASGVRSDFGDLTETAINRLNFSITYGYVFRNGTEIIFTVREGA